MNERKIRIFWRNQEGAHSSGSRIEYRAIDNVIFYNPLITPGEVIKNWNMSCNYQGSRIQPDLPLLKRGHTYQIEADFTTNPAGTAYLQVIFCDLYGKEIDRIIEKSQKLVFTYPSDAYSYSVSLLSAGLVSMDFRCLHLEEVVKEDV